MDHEPRLLLALRALLQQHRVAALGTCDARGAPQVSMVPVACLAAETGMVLHLSALAAHTRNLEQRPQASLLVMQAEVPGEPVHALPRVSLGGAAETPSPGSPLWHACRDAYLARFPEAEPMTALGDFRFVLVRVREARHIAGFGAARTVALEELAAAMQPGPA